MDSDELPPDEIRSPREVALRALALFSAVGAALGAPRTEIVAWLKNERLWEELTPLEIDFLSCADGPQDMRIDFTWQSERLIVLLWALDRVPVLPPSSMQCDTSLFKEILPPYATESVTSFVDSAKLRNDDSLLQKADELLDAHWKARDARLNNRPQPNGIDIEIVQERHHAINWIIGYGGLPWDEVTTDT